jgi:putative transposase
MSYWRLHYHLVWGTYAREPLIDAEREAVIHHTLSGKAHELRVFLHGVGNTTDHLHAVLSIPPKLAVAECVRQLKGASSHAVNHMLPRPELFRWQDGYGAVTVSEDRLAAVVAYATHQREHHARGTLIDALERGDETPTRP